MSLNVLFCSPRAPKSRLVRFPSQHEEDAMSDKHKGHKKDAAPDKREEVRKDKDKPAKTAAKGNDHDMPGAAGFISAGAEEDTYD